MLHSKSQCNFGSLLKHIRNLHLIRVESDQCLVLMAYSSNSISRRKIISKACRDERHSCFCFCLTKNVVALHASGTTQSNTFFTLSTKRERYPSQHHKTHSPSWRTTSYWDSWQRLRLQTSYSSATLMHCRKSKLRHTLGKFECLKHLRKSSQ